MTTWMEKIFQTDIWGEWKCAWKWQW